MAYIIHIEGEEEDAEKENLKQLIALPKLGVLGCPNEGHTCPRIQIKVTGLDSHCSMCV